MMVSRVECLAVAIFTFANRRKYGLDGVVGLLLILFIGLSFLHIDSTGAFGWVYRTINGLLWYCLGYYLKEKNLLSILSGKVVWLWALALFALSVMLGCINGRVDMYGNKFGNIFAYIIAAIVGSGFCLSSSILIGKNKVLEYFGRYSLIVMCTHEPIKRAVIQVVSIVTHKPSEQIRNNIFFGLCFAIAVCALEVIVIEVFRWLSKLTKDKKIHILFEYVR